MVESVPPDSPASTPANGRTQSAAGQPLRRLLINAFVAITIALTVALGWTVTYFAERDITRHAGLMLAALASDMRDKLDLGMAERYRDIKALAATDDALRATLGDKSRRIVYDALSVAHPEYSWIGFADLDGKVLASSNGILTGANVAARPWFSNALKGFFVGDVHGALLLQKYLGGPGEEPMRFVDVAFPVHSKNGEAVGVLGAHVSWSWAEKLSRGVLEVVDGPRAVDLLVLDSESLVLLGPKPLIGKKLELAGLASPAGGLDGFSVMTWPDQKRYLTAYSRTQGLGDYPGLGWRVLVRQDADVAFASVNALRLWAIGVGVVFVVLSLFLGIALAHYLVRPVENMTDAALRVARGEREVAFNAAGSREVQQLSGALRSMVGELGAGEKALREANESLASRVAEATRALSEERERLTNALEGSRLALWDCDLVSGAVTLSGHWGGMIGSPRDVFSTSLAALTERVPAEELPALRAAQVAVMSGQSDSYDVEHRVRRDDGEFIWVRSRGKVTARDGMGRALRLTGTNSDITSRKLAEIALRDQTYTLSLILGNMPTMVNFLDRELRFLFANRRYCDFFGVKENEILGKRLREVVGDAIQEGVMRDLPRLEKGEIVTDAHERVGADGRTRYFEIRQVPFMSGDRMEGVLAFIEEVTARREAERALMESEEQVRSMLDHVPAMISHTGLDCRHRFANKAFLDFFGYSEATVIGRSVGELAGEEAERVLRDNLEGVRAGHQVIYERSRTHANGQPLTLEIRLIPHRDRTGAVDSFYAMMTDVTARKMAEDAIRQQAQTDPLTGLFNKRVLIDRAGHALSGARRNARKMVLLFIDLDGFKAVNDHHGHAIGDVVLKETARRLSAAVRESDTLARVGGDEFILLMENVASREDGAHVGEKILMSLNRPFTVGDMVVSISCSVGISLYPDDGDSVDVLIRKADAAMYKAKAAGKNRVGGNTSPA